VAGRRVETALRTLLPEASDIVFKPGDQVMVWREELRHYVGPKTIDKVSEDRVYVLDDDGIDDGTGVYTKQYSTAQCKRYQEDPDGGQFMNGLNSRLNDPRSGLASNDLQFMQQNYWILQTLGLGRQKLRQQRRKRLSS
jgi:hypothetical protein